MLLSLLRELALAHLLSLASVSTLVLAFGAVLLPSQWEDLRNPYHVVVVDCVFAGDCAVAACRATPKRMPEGGRHFLALVDRWGAQTHVDLGDHQPSCTAGWGEVVFIGTLEGVVFRLNAADPALKPEKVAQLSLTALRRLAVSSNGRHLVGLTDDVLAVYDLESGKELWRSLDGFWQCFAISPCGKSLICGASDGRIGEFDLGSGAPLGTIQHTQEYVWRLAMSPDGTRLLVGERGATLYCRDAGSAHWQLQWSRPGADAAVCAISPSGERIVTDSFVDRTRLSVCDRSSGRPASTFRQFEGGTNGATFLGETSVACWGTDGRVRIWDAATCDVLRNYGLTPPERWPCSSRFH
jgi:WD40 repeat protein